MAIRIGQQSRLKRLREMSEQDALVYFKNEKIKANGRLLELNNLYTEARRYESENADLAAMIATNRALYEYSNAITLNLTLNQHKAIYLWELFEPALLISAIGGV